MGPFPHRRTATRLRPGSAYWRSVLAGVILLALILGASGLLISSLVTSTPSASARVAQVEAIPSHTPKPTRTPHGPPATATPTPIPSATIPPSPPTPTTGAPAPTATPPAAMATMAPTAAATRTLNPGAGRAGSAGSGGDSTPAADGPPGSLVLGLAALALLAFGVFMLLETRRVSRKEQRKEQPRTLPAAAQKTAPARLNQRHQVLPMQKAAPPKSAEDTAARRLEQGCTRKPPLTPQETLPTSLKPPRWLIDAGLLKEDQWDLPAEDAREL
jgi:hypothetical protein